MVTLRQLVLQIIFACIAIASSITLPAQDKEKGFNLGFVYPLSVQGIHSRQYTNVFSLHAFAGLSKGERGFTAAGFGNMILEDASGFQVAGFYNLIGGRADGFKAAGFMNTYGDATGFQSAGFMNISRGNITGMQAAGFLNMAHNIRGFQVAGFLNMADTVNHGAQAAGFINIAGDVEGAQMAGYINIAKKVKGVQISGFLNIADSSEYPIAPVNIIANGEKYIGITTDDNLNTIVSMRSGSKKLYGIIGAGYNFKNTNEVIAVQYGFGAHFFSNYNFRLNVESTVTHLYGIGNGMVSKWSAAALPVLRLGNGIELFGGPSLNFGNTTSEKDNSMSNHYLWRHTRASGNYRMYGMYVGYSAGLHVRF